MFKNYLKIAWRNLQKNKLFTAINIISLSIGLSASFVIGMMIYHDMTFDRFHKDGDRIFRVTTSFSFGSGGQFYNSGVTAPLGETLKDGIQEIGTTAAFFTIYPVKVTSEQVNQAFRNPQGVMLSNGDYFDMFSYNWLAGNKKSALKEPNAVVLSEKRAGKYFPGLLPEEVVGMTTIYNDSIVVTVLGVVENFKERSDLFFEEFISLETANAFGMQDQVFSTNWGGTNSNSQLFVKVNDLEMTASVQQQLDALALEHEDEESKQDGDITSFHLQPLNDIHFSPTYAAYDYSQPQASKSTLKGLFFIALFLLLLGCVNFINLNTAQGFKRSKEVGVRKTLGGSKSQIRYQFLTETFLLTIASALVSILLSMWLLQLFSDFVPASLTANVFTEPMVIAGILALLITVTFIAGFYPAMILSKFKPASAIRNQLAVSNGRIPLRKYLTVFQFAIAQIFVIATLLVGKQINFMMSQDMGIKTDAVVYVDMPWHEKSIEKKERFLNAVKSLPQIQTASIGGRPPASFGYNSAGISYFNDQEEVKLDLQQLFGDTQYADVYGIELLAGRSRLNDTIKEFVINEKAMKLLGFTKPEDALNVQLKISDEVFPVVGVMKDFHQRSLKSGIEPMALVGDGYRNIGFSQFNSVHFSLSGGSETWENTLVSVEKEFENAFPDAEFKLNFMDDMVSRFYLQERKTAKLLKWAMGLSLLISCLGLFGLVIYTTEKRTKEIGIRKILGASLSQLNFLLCKEFLILIGIGFLIAAPVAWYGLDNWLQDFANKTTLSWWIFGISGIAMIALALVIMSAKTIAAANSNPVESLRTE
ncbi:ABC transporter permease [Spongiivirga citrea]|uniref:FtsX-like permease family protein n=1 Tax=Spongiivirga citrea TaxID=1481457 RepID=A0A6M0CHC5_9FLAO|nr:FtsX-like permease family protein [Spongiivirga citrea]NER17338.1 FtsX-like permease family protein [Spongiivirga citrea]